LSEASPAADERARHWIVDAAVGASVALAAITVAHAALPERTAPPQRTMSAAAAAAPTMQPPPTAAAYLIAFEQPVEGQEIISPFGLRQLPWEENGRLHEGVDIAAPLGSPVLAAADGVVVDAGRSDTYGRFVKLAHAEGLTTLYAHMGAVGDDIAPGRAVKAGQPVGQIGSSGTSTGPHLHLEIRDRKGRPLNPGLFLGREFASAEDLPLKKALRVPRGVRRAWVSHIPESKRELMLAKLEKEAAARDALFVGKDASFTSGKGRSVTVIYGDGRAYARFPVGRPKPLPADAQKQATSEPAGETEASEPAAEMPPI